MTTIVTIDMGGTGATHAAGAREALSVPSITDMGQSYAQANAGYAQANAAYGQANTARSDANTTFATINTTFGTVNTSLGTINTNYQAAYVQANTARSDANTTFSTVNTTFATINTNYQAAYAQANTARDTANNAYNNSNTKLSTSGGSISGDLAITGNLTIQGNATTINVTNLSVNDSIILLSTNAVGDSNDIGFIGHFDRDSTATHAGLIRKATENRFYLFDNYENVEPTNNVIDIASNNFRVGNLRLGIINANSFVTSAGMDVTGQANAAYGQANAAYSQANSAYGQANAAYSQANSAYGAANNRVLKAGDTMTGQLNISSGGLLVTGNVGFGMPSPIFPLQVKTNTGTPPQALQLNTTDWTTTIGSAFQFGFGAATGNTYSEIRALSGGYNAWNNLVLQSGGGNVGIGTTSPGYKLDVVGQLAVSNNAAIGGTPNTTDGLAVKFTPAGPAQTGMRVQYTGGSDGTTSLNGYQTNLTTATAAYTVGDVYNYRVGNVVLGAGSAITNLNGFYMADFSVSTNTYGFRGLVSSGTNKYNLYLDGTAQNYIAGNLGIGTTSPSNKLHLYESGASDVVFRLTSANGTYDPLIQFTGQGNDITAEGFEIWYDNDVGDVHLSTTYPNDGATIHFHTRTGGSKSTSNERLTILGNGNVGIGVTTPQRKLDVFGSGILASFGSTMSVGAIAGIHFGYSESSSNVDTYKKSAMVFERTDNHNQGGNASGKIHFLLHNSSSTSASGTNSAVLTLDTDSNATLGSARVGIGTTSPAQTLHVNGNARIDGYITNIRNNGGVSAPSTSDHSLGTRITLYDTTANAWYAIGIESDTMWFNSDANYKWYVDAVQRMLLDGSGNLTIAGTLTESSSITLKENVSPINNALDAITNLVGVTYDRKDGSAKNRAGLIAEEVEQVLPNVVQKDHHGNPSGIQYTNLIAYLVESIKELKAEIDVLKRQ